MAPNYRKYHGNFLIIENLIIFFAYVFLSIIGFKLVKSSNSNEPGNEKYRP